MVARVNRNVCPGKDWGGENGEMISRKKEVVYHYLSVILKTMVDIPKCAQRKKKTLRVRDAEPSGE